jgi:hypothetical protein
MARRDSLKASTRKLTRIGASERGDPQSRRAQKATRIRVSRMQNRGGG